MRSLRSCKRLCSELAPRISTSHCGRANIGTRSPLSREKDSCGPAEAVFLLPGSDWVAEQRAAMAAAEAAAAAGGELPEDDGEEELVGPQLPEAAPGDRGNWGGALRPGATLSLCPKPASGLECGSITQPHPAMRLRRHAFC